MSRQEKREKTEWWLPALIGLILLAAGIRYLSFTEWWSTAFNQGRQTFRTINTGASVQVAASASEQVPTTTASPRPVEQDPATTPGRSEQRRRMW